MEVLLSKYFLAIEHRYLTNIDRVSMVAKWGLEVGKKEEVEWVLKGRVDGDYLLGLQSVLGRAVLGVGFLCVEAMKGSEEEVPQQLMLFLRWPKGMNKDERRPKTYIKWGSLNLFLRDKEREQSKGKKKVVIMEDPKIGFELKDQ